MVTLLVASLLIFLLLEILPGDPAAVILGVGAQEDTLRALRAELGLDLPAPVRYLNWLGEVLQGDLGRSYTYDTPVQELLLNRVELSAAGVVGYFAFNGNRNSTRVCCFPASEKSLTRALWDLPSGVAVPNFWFAILLILLFSVKLGWFSAGGFAGWDAGWFPAFQIPRSSSGCSGPSTGCDSSRVTRSSVLETVQEDYIHCKSRGPQQEPGPLETRGTQRLDPGGYHSRSPAFLPACRNDHH